MKKRVYLIAAVVSGALAVSGCTTNPYTGEREAGKSAIGAGLGSLVGAGIGALSLAQQQAQLWAAAWVITWMCRKRSCVTKCAALVLA